MAGLMADVGRGRSAGFYGTQRPVTPRLKERSITGHELPSTRLTTGGMFGIPRTALFSNGGSQANPTTLSTTLATLINEAIARATIMSTPIKKPPFNPIMGDKIIAALAVKKDTKLEHALVTACVM